MRNRKAESKQALEARRFNKTADRAIAEILLGSSLQGSGWTFNSGNWGSPDGNFSTASIYDAANYRRLQERVRKQEVQKEQIKYLVDSGWRWSELHKKWMRLHWEKVVDVNESPYYMASLRKAVMQQLKIDKKAQVAA
jgi:hypothetical protein